MKSQYYLLVDGTFIFVVNHHPEQDRIEKFKYDSKKNSLLHMESFWDTKLTRLLAILYLFHEYNALYCC